MLSLIYILPTIKPKKGKPFSSEALELLCYDSSDTEGDDAKGENTEGDDDDII